MSQRVQVDRFPGRTTAQSGANAAQTVSTPTGDVRRLLFVTVKYSGAPTHAGVTVTLNSGAGSAYDTLLATGSANAQNTLYIPDEEILILSDDVIDVAAPAGGGALTSAVAIYTETL